MGMLGGVIAGAMSGGAQATGEIASQQIDLNNKQQFAQFQSGLEADRQAQAQRLAQTIGRENTAYAASPEGLAQASAVQSNSIRTAATTAAAPDVLAATEKVEAGKPHEIAPGGQLHQTVDGKDTVIGENKRITGPEAYEYGYRTAAGAASASAKKEIFTQQEIDAGLTSVNTTLKDKYTDPTNPSAKVPGPIANVASQSYLAALNAGKKPVEARVAAEADADQLYANAQVVMKSAKYKDEVKGNLDAALRIAMGLSRPAAPAGQEPTPKAPAQQPAAKAPTATMGNPADDEAPAPTAGAGRGVVNPKPGLVQGQMNSSDSDMAYVQHKLMGPFDGPEKLLEIATKNPNPKFRAAAQALYDQYQAKQQDATAVSSPL